MEENKKTETKEAEKERSIAESLLKLLGNILRCAPKEKQADLLCDTLDFAAIAVKEALKNAGVKEE